MSRAVEALLAYLIAKGVTAESPDTLDEEGGRLAREDRWTEN